MSPANEVVLGTALGDITIALHTAAAPATTRYVLDLIADRRFDGACFYRSTNLGRSHRRRLVQGGPLAPLFTGSNTRIPVIEMLHTLECTATTGLAHVRGTVSLARDLFSTGHVLPELFICLDDYPELDAGGRSEPDGRGFPAFGSVRDGLGVVESIAAMSTDGRSPIDRLTGEVLTSPVTIVRSAVHASGPHATDPEPEPNESRT